MFRNAWITDGSGNLIDYLNRSLQLNDRIA